MSAGGVIGAVIGYFVTGGTPQGAMYGYSIGSGIDAYVNAPDIIGPRLNDLTTQLSVYGTPKPFEWGQNRQTGVIMWPKNIVAVEHEHSESAKGGPEQKTFTYTLSYAIYLCEGPIAGIRRAWKNKKLVYDMSASNTGPTSDGSFGALRFYLGTETQTQDPFIEATDGPGPAYLGSAYGFIEDDDVTEMGGRPNQWEFEILSVGSTTPLAPENLGVGGPVIFYEGLLWTVSGSNCYVYNPSTLALLVTVALPYAAESITAGGGLVWVGYSQTGFSSTELASGISPSTFTIVDSTKFGYGGAVSHLGTVVWYEALGRLYSFTNNGIGPGGKYYEPSTGATGFVGFSGPHYTYQSLEMPDIFRVALTGFGNWLVVGDTANDLSLATITNTAWSSSLQEHRIQYDASRHCLYWAGLAYAGVYKVDLTTYALTLLCSTAGAVDSLYFSPADDKIYVESGTALDVYLPDTGALENSFAGYGVLVGRKLGNAVDVGSDTHYFVGDLSSPPGVLWKIQINSRLVPEQVPLSTIVSDVSVRAGLLTSDSNVAALTDLVHGYKGAGHMQARAVIEPLLQSYFVDPVESDDQIKYVVRGGAIAATIPQADRGAHEAGSAMPDSLVVVRAFELELPYQCDVEYIDVDADHQVGHQYWRRTIKDTRQKIDLKLPIVMKNTKALQVAKTSVYLPWLNVSFRWTTTGKYAHLEPTDVVYLPTDEVTYAARITKRRDLPSGVIEWEGQMEDANVYSQSGDGAAVTGYLPQTIDVPDETILVLIDGPALLDEHDNAGFFVAMGGAL